MIDYTSFPGLAGVYLEDSYVLDISEIAARVVVRLKAVLMPEHPAYRSPHSGINSYYTDAFGERDLGNIDSLTVDGDVHVAEGDWGAVRIFGASPRFALGE